MIRIIVGLPGAGKSYYATWLIWREMQRTYKHWKRGTSPRYVAVHTNIEGLKAGVFIRKLDLKKLEELWKWELEQYKNSEIEIEKEEREVVYWWQEEEEGEERELLGDNIKFDWEGVPSVPLEITRTRFKKEGYWKALFIIDEAHNYFKVARPWAVRWVSFHRHYDQDIYFIVQELRQLDRRIVALAGEIIEAVNPLIRLFPNRFYYRRYAGSYISYRRTNLIEKFSLPRQTEIFDLYESGGYEIPPSPLWKKVGLVGLIGLGMVISFYKLITKGNESASVRSREKSEEKVVEELKSLNLTPPKPKKKNTSLMKAIQIGDEVRIEHKKPIPLPIFLQKYRVVLSQKKGPYLILFIKEKN